MACPNVEEFQTFNYRKGAIDLSKVPFSPNLKRLDIPSLFFEVGIKTWFFEICEPPRIVPYGWWAFFQYLGIVPKILQFPLYSIYLFEQAKP